MKHLLTVILAVLSLGLTAQNKELPSVKVKTLDGKVIDIKDLKNDGHPIVISFWATWCKPCKEELNAIAEEFEEWQKESKVMLIAVSIDDARSVSRVEPYVNGQDWPYTVVLDSNGDLKRALGVNNVPHTFLLDGNGKIVWNHNNYSPGDEDELHHEIQKISKK